jgi:hypothetical protein
LQTQQKSVFPELVRNRGVREQADRLLYGPLQLIDGTFEQMQEARKDRQRAAAALRKRKWVDSDQKDGVKDAEQVDCEEIQDGEAVEGEPEDHNRGDVELVAPDATDSG